MRLSQQIDELCSAGPVTLRMLFDKTGRKGPALGLAVVSLVVLLPTPIVGLFGLVMVPLAVEMLFPKLVGLPASLLDRQFSPSPSSRGYRLVLWGLRRAERFLRPRWPFFFERRRARAVTLALVLLCSLSVLIPFPGTNGVPAAGVLLMCLGIIEDDGLFIVAGWAVSLFGLALASAILYTAYFFGDRALDVIWAWFVAVQ